MMTDDGTWKNSGPLFLKYLRKLLRINNTWIKLLLENFTFTFNHLNTNSVFHKLVLQYNLKNNWINTEKSMIFLPF